MTTSAGSVHVAGEPSGLEQRCIRCGILLVDYKPLTNGQTRINEARPLFFTAGRAVIATDGGFASHSVQESPAAGDPFCSMAPRGTSGVV